MGYREMTMKKRSGGTRILEEPDPVLKFIQRQTMRRLKILVKERIPFPAYITGGFGEFAGTHKTGKFHVDQDVILKLDIQNFFGSVTPKMAYEALYYHLGLPRVTAACVASLATYKNHLPQGSPLSPLIANLSAMSMHLAFNKFAQDGGCAYAVYVDDMYFSASKDSDFGKSILAIYRECRKRRIKKPTIQQFNQVAEEAKIDNPVGTLVKTASLYGFTIKPEKLKVMKRGGKQQIMDVSVSGCPVWGKPEQRTRMAKQKRKEMFCAIHNLALLKPRGSISHIRGLLCQAKRLNDQHYESAKNKFDAAVANWRRYLADTPVTIRMMAGRQPEAVYLLGLVGDEDV